MENTFPGFKYTAKEVSAYLTSQDLFTLALKSKKVIHHTPTDAVAFRAWLDGHKIRDVSKG